MMEVFVATTVGFGIGCILVLALAMSSEAIDRAIIRRLQLNCRLMEAKR